VKIDQQEFDRLRTVIFTSGDDRETRPIAIAGVGFKAIDLGSVAKGGAMHQVGAPLSGLDLRVVSAARLQPAAQK